MMVIDVVGGLIVREGRMLLTQRKADQDFPFAWEHPGGKVINGINGESSHAALLRELAEEIGIGEGDGLGDALLSVDVQRPGRASVHWRLYAVPSFTGTPSPCEGQGIGWFTLEEAARLQLTPGSAAALQDPGVRALVT